MEEEKEEKGEEDRKVIKSSRLKPIFDLSKYFLIIIW